MNVWRHMTRLWPRFTLLPALPFTGWAAYWLVRAQLRWDQLAVAILAGVLAYGNATTKRMFFALLPLGLVGLFYDAMRFVKNLGLGGAGGSGVHLCDLRDVELRFFGLNVGGVRVTLHDWFQAHAVTALDLFCAVPYGTFLFVVIGYAVFLYTRDFSAQQRFTWGFFALNVVGFMTYHLYPAAPPWYFHAHGCAVDLAQHASAGPNLTRVDEMLGVAYFAGMYGRSSDVFGAVPSLHVAYPLLMITEGWSRHRKLGRTALALFYVWMCFSAVYLDHHWVIDIVVGSSYALLVALALRWIARRNHPHAPRPLVMEAGGGPTELRW